MNYKTAYHNAGFKANDKGCEEKSWLLNGRPEIQARIRELQDQNTAKARNDYTADITGLHDQTVEVAREILAGENVYAKNAIIKEVWSRSSPIVKQTTNVKVSITGPELQRRKALLERKRASVTTTTIVPIDNHNSDIEKQ